MADLLDIEYKFYLDHKADLLKQYGGKVIVLQGGQVIGVYESVTEAALETVKHHPLGSFLVQAVQEEDGIRFFNSRVSAPVRPEI